MNAGKLEKYDENAGCVISAYAMIATSDGFALNRLIPRASKASEMV